MTERNFFEKHPKLIITCFIVVGIIFSDFLLANIYRLLNNQSFFNKITNPAYIKEKQYRIPSTIYHHDLKKNASFAAMYGFLNTKMITNSLGFRDQENREIPNISSKHRIVFIGDSFTEGSGVPFPDSFVGILENKYASKYDILNAGVASYAPTVYYRKTRYYLEQGLKFDEMILMLDISDIYDEVRIYQDYDETETIDLPLTEMNPPAPKGLGVQQYFQENSILYVLPRWFKAIKTAPDVIKSAPPIKVTPETLDTSKKSIVNFPRALWTVDKKYYAKYGEAGLKKAKLNILNLKQLLDKNHIKLTLVVYPWPTQIYYKDLDSIQVKEWQSFCDQHAITFVNLFPDFISENPQININTILKYYIEDNMHWNEKGHQKVADLLEKKLAIFSPE